MANRVCKGCHRPLIEGEGVRLDGQAPPWVEKPGAGKYGCERCADGWALWNALRPVLDERMAVVKLWPPANLPNAPVPWQQNGAPCLLDQQAVMQIVLWRLVNYSGPWAAAVAGALATELEQLGPVQEWEQAARLAAAVRDVVLHRCKRACNVDMTMGLPAVTGEKQ